MSDKGSNAADNFDLIGNYDNQGLMQFSTDGLVTFRDRTSAGDDTLVNSGTMEITTGTSLDIGSNSLGQYNFVNSGTIVADGDIAFREPGVLLRGSEAFIDSNSGRNTVDAAHYVLHASGIHGAAQTIDYDSATGLIMLDNGEFSR